MTTNLQDFSLDDDATANGRVLLDHDDATANREPQYRAIGLLHTILVDHLNVAADSHVLVQNRVRNCGSFADPQRYASLGTHDGTLAIRLETVGAHHQSVFERVRVRGCRRVPAPAPRMLASTRFTR